MRKEYITLASFKQLSQVWGMPYPSPGEIVTVIDTKPHDVKRIADQGVSLLILEEYPNLPYGLCDKTFDGVPNFVPVPKELK